MTKAVPAGPIVSVVPDGPAIGTVQPMEPLERLEPSSLTLNSELGPGDFFLLLLVLLPSNKTRLTVPSRS